MHNDRIITKAVNRINKKLNQTTDYITLDDYFNISFAYLDYLNQELTRISHNMKTNFEFNPTSLKIKSVQKEFDDLINEDSPIWLITLTLQTNNDEHLKDLYITVSNGHIEYNTSFLKERGERDTGPVFTIDKKSLKELVELIITNYNFLSLTKEIILDSCEYNSYLWNRLKLSNQDILFHSLNFTTWQYLDTSKRELVLETDTKNEIYLQDEEARQVAKRILIDLDKLPMFIKDYQELFPQELTNSSNKEEKLLKKIFHTKNKEN